ncbi:MAG: molybdenum cofactor guanylyltransferase [Chloroflexi bacterium]|nr:molybdenum cofactor guanylyltransferase [Chloroflexota bacterium]
MNGIILAGGRSRRLGTDKTVLEIGGRRLIEVVLDIVAAVAHDVIIVTNSPHLFESLPARLTGDVQPGTGPLGGILSGLLVSDDSHSLVVACDMPFLNLDLLIHMRQCADGCDVVMPRLASYFEPLHAIYSKACIEPIQSLLADNNFKIIDLLDQARVRYLDEPEIDRFDPERMTFFNINTREDLEKARREFARRSKKD